MADVYLLSRILHDWDDEHCLVMLAAIREAMRAEGRLVLIERLLPQESAAAPLTARWDLQMMVNADGRERTLAEYTQMLERAGFEVKAVLGLPLDASAVVATLSPTVGG